MNIGTITITVYLDDNGDEMTSVNVTGDHFPLITGGGNVSDDPCPHHCQTNIGASQWRCEECGEVISACPHCPCTYTTECCYCDGSRTPLEDS